MIFEPNQQPDDTQPNPAHLEQTQPLHLKPGPRRLPRWVFGALMVFTSLTLVLTLSLITSYQPATISAVSTRTPLRISISANNQVQEIITTRATVGDLLAEQAITVAPEDAISHSPDTLLTMGMTIVIARARDVRVTIDGQTQIIRTPYEMPFDILKRANIELNETDRLWLDSTEIQASDVLFWSIPVTEITIKRTMMVTIIDGGSERHVETTASSVGDVLFESDIQLYLTDIIQPDLGTSVTDGMTIQIQRAQPIYIELDDTVVETRVQGGTVLDALAEGGITISGLDYAVPDLETPVTSGMTIRIVRVTEQIISEDSPIPYDTTLQSDATLELDTRQTISAGQAGIQRRNIRVRYEDGVEISREEAGTEVIQAPVNEVVAYGTNIVLRTVDTPDGPREYWRKLRVYATSYHPAALGGDNITAIGETLRKGIVGADPGIIPYRTNIFVPGYGTGFIADTGGARSSRYWIDLGYSDEDWVSWSRYVDIYLLTPVPANLNYLLPAWTPLRGRSDNR